MHAGEVNEGKFSLFNDEAYLFDIGLCIIAFVGVSYY